MLNDATRLRLLALIHQEGRLCVCEGVFALDMLQPRVSRHLLTLRESGLLVSSRHAQWVFYSINPDLLEWQQQVLAGALVGIQAEKIIEQDRMRLKKMQDRPFLNAA